MRWSEEQVLALAPDPAALRAARAQAAAAKWSAAGASDAAVWGLCQGSGAQPYQVAVDPTGPAFRCTCPSRKIPCKHAVGLLLRWVAGEVPSTTPPDWVATWLTDRAARAERAASRAEDGPADPERAARSAQARADRRADRVAAGVAELGDWLADQVRAGVAGLATTGARSFRTAAARMVDAQAPGLAGALTRAADLVGRGPDWPGRVLTELAGIHLLLRAHDRLAELPGPLADTVRGQLGFTVDTADVLAHGDRVVDDWLVLGRVDTVGDRLTTRRVWLHGRRTGRAALVLSFAPPGRPLDGSLTPGTAVAATAVFYPGTAPLRVALTGRAEPPDPPAPCPAGASVAGALGDWAAVLARDPWCAHWPIVLAAVTPVPIAGGWALAEADGTALPVHPLADPWPLVAVAAGRPLTVAGEWSASGLRPVGCWDGDRPVAL